MSASILSLFSKLKHLVIPMSPSAALKIDTSTTNGHKYENIILEKLDRVAIITLNRPTALNALNAALVTEMGWALEDCDTDNHIGCIILTGMDKAFAAGADIKEMQAKDFSTVYLEDYITKDWERVTQCRKPVIAAVSGFALGGGCEMAMMCDFIIAADNAKFGQPEVNLGIIPGSGGTQRLCKALGKSKAMEMCLTGRMMDANEAEKAGLVARVVPLAELRKEAIKTAQIIASKSRPSVYMIKEAINKSFETFLSEGVHLERRLFHACFATGDQKEGMQAFIDKRKPEFKNQ